MGATMPGPHPPELHVKLAVAIASGDSIAAWAKLNDVARRTAYEWSRSAEVKRRVASLRRRALDRAVGKLTKGALSAADVLLTIATGEESAPVRLQAARAILADLAALSDFARIKADIEDLKRKLATEKRRRASGTRKNSG
jgi:hypothetical protein